MSRQRLVVAIALVSAMIALPLIIGCGKGKKSTNPAVGALELDSGNIAGGGVYPHRFMTAGAYAYHCSIHSGMTGLVIVSPSAPATDSLMSVDATSSMIFSPNSVTIPVGGKVTWTNTAPFAHTVTSD